MDDIIVIILTLLLTIFAAINQSKKKKQQQSQNTSSEPDFWETILHGEEGTPVPVKTPPARQPSVSVRQQPVASKTKTREPLRKSVRATDSYTIFPDEGGRSDDVLIAAKKQDVGFENQHERENDLTILEDFSLRKAIIYSEIIQPKYF
jgi:hypothetical protein